MIPKNYQPGKWWLSLDLSSPLGRSINDGILKEPFSVQYTRLDDVISGIMSFGQGTLLAKFDVVSAYRNIPVHPDDRYYFAWHNGPSLWTTFRTLHFFFCCRFARVDPQTQLWLEFPLALS